MSNEAGGPGDSEAEVWRKKLAEAERKYRGEMKAFAATVGQAAGDEVAAAAKRRDEAREEFQRILRIFSDLVIRGRSPGRKP